MEKDDAKEKRFLFIIKGITVFYIIALFFWGVTAFPLESELNILCQIMGISTDTSPDNYEGLKRWIATINEGLTNTNRDYPFMAYGLARILTFSNSCCLYRSLCEANP